jgi:hypothetical protein
MQTSTATLNYRLAHAHMQTSTATLKSRLHMHIGVQYSNPLDPEVGAPTAHALGSPPAATHIPIRHIRLLFHSHHRDRNISRIKDLVLRPTPTRMPLDVWCTLSPSATTNLAICLTLIMYFLASSVLMIFEQRDLHAMKKSK